MLTESNANAVETRIHCLYSYIDVTFILFSINIFVPMTDEVMKFVCKPLALRRTLSSFFSSSIGFTEQLIGCKDRHGNKDGKDLPERRERGAGPILPNVHLERHLALSGSIRWRPASFLTCVLTLITSIIL